MKIKSNYIASKILKIKKKNRNFLSIITLYTQETRTDIAGFSHQVLGCFLQGVTRKLFSNN